MSSLPLWVTQCRNLPRRDVGNLSSVSHLTSCLQHPQISQDQHQDQLILLPAHVEYDGAGDHLVRDDEEGRGRPGPFLGPLLLPDVLWRTQMIENNIYRTKQSADTELSIIEWILQNIIPVFTLNSARPGTEHAPPEVEEIKLNVRKRNLKSKEDWTED